MKSEPDIILILVLYSYRGIFPLVNGADLSLQYRVYSRKIKLWVLQRKKRNSLKSQYADSILMILKREKQRCGCL